MPTIKEEGTKRGAGPRVTEADRLPALIEAGALFVANHSGGKDSQALLVRLLEVVPAAQILVVHASLGEAEWPGALELFARYVEIERRTGYTMHQSRRPLEEVAGITVEQARAENAARLA